MACGGRRSPVAGCVCSLPRGVGALCPATNTLKNVRCGFGRCVTVLGIAGLDIAGLDIAGAEGASELGANTMVALAALLAAGA